MQSKGYLERALAAAASTAAVDMRGKTGLAIYVPACDSATITLECSRDGSTFKQMKETDGSTVVGQWSASTGDFWLDGDTLARFVGVPYLRLTFGANQTLTTHWWVW